MDPDPEYIFMDLDPKQFFVGLEPKQIFMDSDPGKNILTSGSGLIKLDISYLFFIYFFGKTKIFDVQIVLPVKMP